MGLHLCALDIFSIQPYNISPIKAEFFTCDNVWFDHCPKARLTFSPDVIMNTRCYEGLQLRKGFWKN
ncbi:Hypothetical predicted protein [Octopus vulgaris]|uniref:Uncharacterized protein n=1 Tax=Octopus vulgaris TaxID=6645 RepID=A0AA36AY55_OCTVU|nr:Hypothetical predicted protein [Octopus vulgaris]